MRAAVLAIAIAIVAIPNITCARGNHASADVPRNSSGRIYRSSSAKSAFKRANPCPATGKASGPCPGYIIDHVVPLKRGGPDAPTNMQWQTREDAKAKDRWE